MQKRIAHITDTHLDDPSALGRGIDPRKNLTDVLETIVTQNIDELVFTGDIGGPETLGWFFDKLEEYKPGFKITLGNHDAFTDAVKHFTHPSEGVNELYYSEEDEYYKHIFMDSSSGTVSMAQLDWLSQQVTTAKKIVVFIHHPILGLDTAVDTVYPLHNRDDVQQLLQQSRQQVTVFCGHYQMPDKRSSGKIIQYITPAVSFQVKKFAREIEVTTNLFAFRIITLTEHAVKTQLMVNFYDTFMPQAL